MTAAARKVTIALIAFAAALAIALTALPATSQAKTFPDVPEGAWYYDVVDQASDAGLAIGYDNGKFGPLDKATRGQVATILWRAADSPDAASYGFSDVASGKYYTTAVDWCAANGIVTGYVGGSSKTFRPNSPVARQDLTVMLARYAAFKGVEVQGSDAWKSLGGADKVSAYAQDAVAWGVDAGIIGSNGKINARNSATRAEVVKMTLAALEVINGVTGDTAVNPPTAVTGLYYNGSEQTGVPEGEGYTLTGNKATMPGDYEATATLAEGYVWGDGSSAPKTISWSIGVKQLGPDTQKGDHVFFGVYEQDNNADNGKEAIGWRVLDVQNGKALLISEHGLDCLRFNENPVAGNDWGTSGLKTWLEDGFTESAFTADELAWVDGAPFCLSAEEAEEYFTDDKDRVCTPTEYAKSKDAYPYNGACIWWLRSAGTSSTLVAAVTESGFVDTTGYDITDRRVTVRPALWVNL